MALLVAFLVGPVGVAQAEGETVLVSGDVVLPQRYREARVRGGRVQFRGVNHVHVVTARFSLDGTYSVRLLRGVRYRLAVHRLYVAVGGKSYRLGKDDLRVVPQRIEVPPHGPVPQPRLEIHGREGDHRARFLVETDTGRPVPGARIVLVGIDRRHRFSIPYGVATTDLEGVAAFHELPPGRARAQLIETGPFARTKRSLVRRSRSTAFRSDIVIGAPDAKTTGFTLFDAGVLDVTVDTSGWKEPPPVAVWSTNAELVAGPRTRPLVAGTSAVYRFESLAPGRYRVVATYPDASALYREAEVVSGRVTPLLLSRSRQGRIGYEFLVRWESMPASVRRAHFYLTSLEERGKTSAYVAARGHAIRRRYGPVLRNGSYLLRYPAQGLARPLSPATRTSRLIDFTPPRPGFLSRGHRTVTVRVSRRGKPLRDLFVGLKMQKRMGGRAGSWMRYLATTDDGAVFKDVPAGWYEIHLIDRVLGEIHDVKAKFRNISVWRDDVTVDWKLVRKR